MATETLRALRTFVLEDQPLLASALIDGLTAAGVNVVGHVSDVSNAFEWLERGVVPNVALVDVLLHDEPSYPVVDRLRKLPTATILMTGVDCEQIPSAYRDIPCLERPFRTHDLINTITKVLGTALPGIGSSQPS